MFRRSKSIRELYDEAKGFDLVITNDPALATGLNRMVDHLRIGAFALTPRQLAARYGALMYGDLFSMPQIIAKLSVREKQPVRTMHPLIEKIFGIWRNTGILEYCEPYLSRDEFEFVKMLREFPTIELCMEEFDEEFIRSGKIAVAGASLFNLLDQQVLPKKKPYSVIDLFTDEDHFPVDKTFMFTSNNEIVNAIVDSVNEDNAGSTAIVINFDSPNLTSLKSRLHNKGVEIIDRKFLSRDAATQDLLKILAMSFRADELIVSEIRQLSDNCGLKISRRYDEWLFDTYVSVIKDELALKTNNLLKGISKMKFGKVMNELENQLGMDFCKNLKDVTELLNLNNRKADEDTYNELSYFIKNIDIETERSDSGVLIANSQNSVFINREIVYYVGMDSSWTKLVGDVEYIDKSEEEVKNLEKFQILLNQGRQRIYIAASVTGGEATIPCHYFNILLKKDLKEFDDDLFKPISAIASEHTLPELRVTQDLPVVKETTTAMSQSRLKTFYQCPKKYSYSQIIPSIDYPWMTKGTLIHNFAEFCFDYPDFCRKFFDRILERIIKEFSESSGGTQEDIERSQFRLAMEQVIKFIENLSIEKTPYELTAEPNFLYKEFRKSKKFANSENLFSEIPPGIKGRIDLLGGNEIFDYKSSSKATSTGSHINQSNLSILKSRKSPAADFQAPMYLLFLQMKMDDESEGCFNFVYPLADQVKVIRGQKQDVTVKSLRYIPEDYFDYLTGMDFYGMMNEKYRTVKKFSHERWIKLLMMFRDRIESGEDISQAFSDEFRRIITEEMDLEYADFNRKAEHTFEDNDIKPVGKQVQSGRIDNEKNGLIFKDDIERFKEYLADVLLEVNVFADKDFPYRPAYDKRKICYDCEYLSICTGNKLWEGSGETISETESEEQEE